MPYDVMFSICRGGQGGQIRMFRVMAFVFPSNCYIWWSPVFLEKAEHLPADRKE